VGAVGTWSHIWVFEVRLLNKLIAQLKSIENRVEVDVIILISAD
jgi:hypothetical protein